MVSLAAGQTAQPAEYVAELGPEIAHAPALADPDTIWWIAHDPPVLALGRARLGRDSYRQIELEISRSS